MIRHLLLDADGVVQDLPGGWRSALRPFLGERVEEFVAELARDEQACMRGEPFLPVLGRLLAAFDSETPAVEVHAAAWENIAPEPGVLELADRLRATGLGVHLATNQSPERAAYMRRELGYDARFDTQFYSCELGVAKPERGYFERILDAVGASPDEVMFVDDSARNVAGAREVGLSAEQWHLDEGMSVLLGLLAVHDVG